MMAMLGGRSALSLFILSLSATNNLAASQHPRGGVGQQQQLQPLGDVLHMVLDKDKNQKVTMSEVDSQLGMLGELFSEQTGGTDEETGGYRTMLKVSKVA